MAATPYSAPWLLQHLRILVLGLLVGVLAVAFRYALDFVVTWRPWLMLHAGGPVPALLVSVVYSAFLIPPAVWLVAAYCPEAAGSGIPGVKALARHAAPLRWLRLIAVKFTGGVFAIGGGLTLGREGPTVQMGAAIGEALGNLYPRATPHDRRQLLLLGAGAGLAGAFSAPLAGTLFICEELGEEFSASNCLSALLATFTADGVCRLLSGQSAQLGTYPLQPPELGMLPLYLLLGWLGGVFGVVFNLTLLGSLRLVRGKVRWGFLAFLVLLTGVLGWYHKSWVGADTGLLDQIRDGEMDLRGVLVLLGIRAFLLVGGYSTGAAGGLFAPLLTLGALMGHGLGLFAPESERLALTLVGMAALLTGVVRAPLTGILLLMEMARAHTLIFPLACATLMAKLTADALGNRPIYDALLEATPARPRSPAPDSPAAAG